MLFLDGETFQPLFAHNTAPGSEIRWHRENPGFIVYVNGNTLGFWNVRDDTKEPIASFEGYSNFQIGPWEGNLSLDGNRLVIVADKGEGKVAFA